MKPKPIYIGRNIDNRPTLPISDELIQRQRKAREVLEKSGLAVDLKENKNAAQA